MSRGKPNIKKICLKFDDKGDVADISSYAKHELNINDLEIYTKEKKLCMSKHSMSALLHDIDTGIDSAERTKEWLSGIRNRIESAEKIEMDKGL